MVFGQPTKHRPRIFLGPMVTALALNISSKFFFRFRVHHLLHGIPQFFGTDVTVLVLI